MTTTQLTPASRTIAAGHRETPVVALCVLGAGLMIASGVIHLHLWMDVYRHIKTGHMNTLFVVQWVLCFVGALALLVMRNLLAVVAGAGLLAGTYIGFLISKYHHGGLFGFYLGNFSSGYTTGAAIVEIAGTVVLVIAAVAMLRTRPTH